MLVPLKKIRLIVGSCGLLAGLFLGAVSLTSAADVVVNETLIPGTDFYGVDASSAVSPFVNNDNYSLIAAGDDSGSYDDVNFKAYGIFSSTAVEIENFGNINLTATGGTAISSTDFAVAGADAYGIYSDGIVTNSGNITLTSTGGISTAVTTSYAAAYTGGINATGSVTNSGAINMTATGGTASSDTDVYARAFAFAYGIDSDDTVTNSGNITLTSTGGTATSGTDAYTRAYAYGIHLIGAVNNSGDITLAATGGNATSDTDAAADAYAYGIDSDDTVTNSGNITLTSTGGIATADTDANAYAYAYGIYSDGFVNNNGVINVTATGGTATSNIDAYARAFAYAYGIDSDGFVNNNGAITMTATGGTATSGTEANARAYAYGIYPSGAVDNSGDITLTTTGGTATADLYAKTDTTAYGIYSNDTVTNSGDITLTSTGGISAAGTAAYASATTGGIYATGAVTNSGAITMTATGGTATSDTDTYAGAYAVAFGLQSSDNVTNTGDITATAIYGTGSDPYSSVFGEAHAAAVGIISSGGEVFNSGDITVTALAAGIYDTVAVGILLDGDGSLTNTGIIQAFGDTQAYEVAVMSGAITLVDNYNLNLDLDPTIGSLYVAGGATLGLNDAMLSVTSVGGTTRLNTEYKIFDTSDGGTVSGAFGGLIAPLNPGIVALYHDQSTLTSADDTVSLGFQPGASPQLEAVDLLRHAITLSADLVGQRLTTGFLQTRLAARAPRLYAAAHTLANDAGGQYSVAPASSFFFSPYYASIDKDASPVGYDADLVGFMTGLEHQAGSNLYGFHLGYSHAGLDFTGNGYNGNEEDQELLSAGMHLMGSRGHWTWRGQMSGFYGWHDYEGLTGVNLEQRENADYNSYGVNTTLLGGYLLPIGKQMLLPEAGIQYLWLHRDSFTTDAADPGWDVRNSSLDEHQVSVLASLRWLTRLQVGEVEVTPSLAAGVRCLLTDDELDVHQSMSGSGPVSVKTGQDDVSGTVSASVKFRKEQLSSELAYGGEFGDETTMHSAWLRFYYLF